MEGLQKAVNEIILNTKYADILTLIKAARNGAVYGAKVRFPHALVMVFLFRNGTVREKLHLIFRATRQHARNLAKFAFLYKGTLLLLRHSHAHLSASTGAAPVKERSMDTFLAGLLGGYIVFGRGAQSSVNQQISIYVFARVVLGLAKLAVAKGVVPDTEGEVSRNAWPVFASVSWALVMWLFRWYPEVLQPSLQSSMRYIYTNADTWDSFRTLLIHNK